MPEAVAVLVASQLKEQFNIEGVVPLTNRDVSLMITSMQTALFAKFAEMEAQAKQYVHPPPTQTQQPNTTLPAGGAEGGPDEQLQIQSFAWSDGTDDNPFPESFHFTG